MDLLGMQLGIEIRSSPFVPETSPPPPCKKVGEFQARRGGRRTDFGRHFRSDAYSRGAAAPAPLPTPCYYMIDGVCHMHPKMFERLKAATASAELKRFLGASTFL